MIRLSRRADVPPSEYRALISTLPLLANLACLALICSRGAALQAEPPSAGAPVAATVPDARSNEPAKYPAPADVRASFLKLLDRPKVDPDVKELSPPRSENGLTTEHLSIATERKADGTIERVPMLIVRPEKVVGRLPVVIALHGTGGNKEGQRGLIVELAHHGIIGVAIDARYHGERAGGAHGADAYVAAITRAWRTPPGQPQEHPFYYDTCWDLWRTIDYLSTRGDVDPKSFGMIGFSMGGIETWLAASVDERIRVAVPAIGVQSLRWSVDHDRWQGRAGTIRAAHEAAAHDLGEPKVNARVCRELWSKVIPGILDQYDCPSMIRRFAPRPLLIISGEKDPNNPLEGARLAFASAKAAYHAAGADDKLVIDVAPGVGHQVTNEQNREAIEWLERWLK
jgi:dienelactone hydrolase